jgi:hypothetical protein
MKKSTILTFVLAMTVAGMALAQDALLGETGGAEGLTKINSLALTLTKWIQGIALVGGVISLIFAGYTISTGSSEGTNKLKSAIIGIVVCAAAAGIATFLKSQVFTQ